MRKKTQTKVEDDFLSRWSAKKTQADNPLAKTQAAADHEDAINSQALVEPDTESQQPDVAVNDQAVLTDEDMPEIETLDEKSDFSGFLSPGVSDELRKLALRKLFRSQVFNVRDGLDDYDDDFRSFAALGDIITSDMKHQMELAEEREKEKREQQKLDAEQELALEDNDDNTIDDQASDLKNREDSNQDDQNTVAKDSENEDEMQENETAATGSPKKQNPQSV